MKSLEEKCRQDLLPVSQEDYQVSVIARMSICFDEIRSERADFWRTDRRLVVAKRLLHDILGPEFSDTSPESRSDSMGCDRIFCTMYFVCIGQGRRESKLAFLRN